MFLVRKTPRLWHSSRVQRPTGRGATLTFMKPPPWLPRSGSRRAAEQGSVRAILLPIVCFALGLAVAALWSSRPGLPASSRQPAPELTETTKLLLAGLPQPIDIHFYCLLDPGAPPALAQFAQRADRLLSLYELQANGKLTVTRFDSQTNASPNAALAEGIRGFDLDKGQGCYLGLALSSSGRKEVLPQLSPGWEQALEADISRAIERLAESGATQRSWMPATPAQETLVSEIRQLIPNLDAISLDDGTRILRETSVKEFAAAAGELQARVQEAQARVVQARAGGSAADQDAAIKNLQVVQAEQAKKLKDIAADAQARIDALRRLKGTQK